MKQHIIMKCFMWILLGCTGSALFLVPMSKRIITPMVSP